MKARSSEITISLCFDKNNMFYISLKTGFFFLFFQIGRFFFRIKKQVLPLVQIFKGIKWTLRNYKNSYYASLETLAVVEKNIQLCRHGTHN